MMVDDSIPKSIKLLKQSHFNGLRHREYIVEIYRVRKSKIANNFTSYSLNLQKPTLFGLIASRSSQRVSTFNGKPQCIGI